MPSSGQTMPQPALERLLKGVEETARQALEEDRADEDLTTKGIIDASLTGRAAVTAKAAGVIAGLPVAQAVYRAVDAAVAFRPLVEEGARVRKGQQVAEVEGSLASILRGERVALNFLQRLSGTATLTAKFVKAVEGTGARLLDTRKTTPGLRLLEKYAVRVGGGSNHRLDLSGGILIKDTHIEALRQRGMTLGLIVQLSRSTRPPGMAVEVEVTSVAEAREAADAGAEMLLLDNMAPEEMREAVEAVQGRCATEASGGVTLRKARRVAEAGVDYVSVGALTHSAPALDLSLRVLLPDPNGTDGGPRYRA